MTTKYIFKAGSYPVGNFEYRVVLRLYLENGQAVMALRSGDDLMLVYADGSVITLEHFFSSSNSATVSVETENHNFSYRAGTYVSEDAEDVKLLSFVGRSAGVDALSNNPSYGSYLNHFDFSNSLGSDLVSWGLNNSFGADAPSSKTASYAPGYHGDESAGGLGSVGLAGLAVLGLAGAGGGSSGSSGSSSLTTEPSLSVDVTFTAGPVVLGHGLTVSVFDDQGKLLLDGVMPNTDGNFSFLVPAYTGGIVRIQVNDTNAGDDYIEESTGQAVDLSVDSISALVSPAYVDPESLQAVVNISPVTELVVRYLLATDAELIDANILQAEQVVAKALGITLDSGEVNAILAKAPVASVDASGNANSNTNDYGMALAAMSGMRNQGGLTMNDLATALSLELAFNDGKFLSTTLDAFIIGADHAIGASSDAVAAQLNNVTDFSNMAAADIQQLNNKQLSMLSDLQVATLQQVSAFEQLLPTQVLFAPANAIIYVPILTLLNLTADELATLSPDQISGLNTDQVSQLMAKNMLDALGGSQVAALEVGSVGTLTQSMVVKLSADDLASMSVEQLAELTSAQFGYLVAEDTSRLSKLNADQIPALGANIAALTASQVAALGDAQLSALSRVQAEAIAAVSGFENLSAEQICNLSGVAIGLITVSAIEALDAAQVQALSFAQLGGLTSAQVAALLAEDASQILSLSPGQIAALGSSILELSAVQLASLGDAQLIGLTASQIGALATADLLTNLSGHQISQLGGDIAALSATQVAALSDEQLAGLITAQGAALAEVGSFDELSAAQISVLTQYVFPHVPAQTLAQLSAAAFAALTDVQLTAITAEQATAFSPDAFDSLSTSQLGLLSPGVLAHVSGSLLSVLNADEIAALTNAQLGALTASQARAIADSNGFDALSAAQVLALDASVFSYLPLGAVSTMTANDLSQLTAAQLAELNSEQGQVLANNQALDTLSLTQVLSLIHVLVYIDSQTMAQLSADQVASMSSAQFSFLTAEQITAMDFSAVLGHQINALNAAAIGAVPAKTFSTVSDLEFASLSNDQLASLTATQVQSIVFLGGQHFVVLSPTQIKALGANIAELSAAQIAELSSTQLNGLTSQQAQTVADGAGFDDLSGTKVSDLNATVLAWIPAKVMTGMSSELIATMNEGQLRALTGSQASVLATGGGFDALTAAQITYLAPDAFVTVPAALFGDWTVKQVAALPDDLLAVMTEVQAQIISASSGFDDILPNQALVISAEAFPYLPSIVIDNLTAQDVANLSDMQLSLISAAQAQEFGSQGLFNSLTAEQITAISADALPYVAQLSSLTPAQMASLSSTQTAGFSSAQVTALTNDQFDAMLAAGNLNEWTSDQVDAIALDYLRSLSATQVSAFPDNIWACLSATQFAAMVASGSLAEVTAQQMASVSPSTMAKLSVEDLSYFDGANWFKLTSEQFSAMLQSANVSNMTAAQTTALSESMLAELSATDVSLMSATQWSGLNAIQFGSMWQAGNLSDMSTTQITYVTPAAFAGLSASQIGAMSSAFWGVLTGSQLIAVARAGGLSETTGEQLSQVNVSSISALTPSDIAALTNTQLAGLTVAQLEALASVEPNALSALSSSQKAVMSSDIDALIAQIRITDVVDANGNGAPEVFGTADALSHITITAPDGSTFTTTANDAGNYSLELHGLEALPGTYKVFAVDTGGFSSALVSRQETDLTAAIEVSRVIDADANGDPEIFGVADANATVTITAPESVTFTTTAGGDGVFALELRGLNQTTGSYAAKCLDPLGNSSATVTFTASDVSASVSITDVVDSDGDGNPEISGTAEAYSTVTITAPDEVTTFTATVDGDGNYSQVLSGIDLIVGTYSAQAVDILGNASSITTRIEVDVSSVVSIMDVVDSDGDGNPEISGTGEANSTVTITAPSGETFTTTTDSFGDYSTELTGLQLIEGTYSARVKDPSGNTSAAANLSATDLSASATITDVTGITSGIPTISGTVDANSAVTIIAPGGETFTTTADVNGNYTLDLVNVSELNGVYSVYALDPAGNRSATARHNTTNAQGFVINGVAASDQSGRSISLAGDVNGDGLTDLLVGAPSATIATGDPNTGCSYIVFGKADSTAIDLATVSAGVGGFLIVGKYDAFAYAGTSVAAAGDVNGDGYADVIIGAPGVNAPGTTDGGASYLVFGKADGVQVDLSDVTAANMSYVGNGGFVIYGGDGDEIGTSVSAAGDMNGDGLDDVIVGAPGTDNSYVIYGKRGTEGVDLQDVVVENAGFVIRGAASGSIGYSVSGAGDVNGDGWDDLIVGSPYAFDNLGFTYVVFGSSSAENIDLSNVEQGIGGFVIRGENHGDFAGYSVSSAGDVNGDGLADLLIGKPDTDTPGKAYVLFGKADGDSVDLDDVGVSVSGFTVLQDEATFEYLGSNVSAAGDVNGDGLADLVVSAPWRDVDGLLEAGVSYVVFGKTDESSVFLSEIQDGLGGFAILGESTGDHLGLSFSAAGDVNGDGLSDLFVGAPYMSGGASKSYVVFGKRDTLSVDLSEIASGSSGETIADFVDTGGNDSWTGTYASEIALGGLGDDTLTGGGGADVLYGGMGNDTLVVNSSNLLMLEDNATNGDVLARVDGGAGIDVLQLDGAAIRLDLTSISNAAGGNPLGGSRIASIEVIDLTGSGDNTLIVDALDVVDMTGMNIWNAEEGMDGLTGSVNKHQLMILGDDGDRVDIDVGDGSNQWTAAGYVDDALRAYAVWNHNTVAAQLLIENSVAVIGYVPGPIGFEGVVSA